MQIPIPAGAQARIRAILPLTALAIAGLVTAAVTLDLNRPTVMPAVVETPSIRPAAHGLEPGLGLALGSVPKSLPAVARHGSRSIPGPCPERDGADGTGALPLCRVGISAATRSLVVTLYNHGAALSAALHDIDDNDLAGARAAAHGIDAVAEHIVSWIAATSGTASVKSTEIAATIATLRDWPGQSLMRARYEEALAREQPDPAAVLGVFAQLPPVTAAGTVLFAKALAASGKTEEAQDLVRRYWREELNSGEAEQAILSAFGSALTAADHQARVARLVYQGRTAEAEHASRLLDKGPQELVKAWIAATRQRHDAGKLLDNVAAEQRQDPAYLFARILTLRQAGHSVEAAALMQSAPTDPTILINPDAWSEERRLLARDVAEKGPRTALNLTSADVGASGAERMNAEFDAGWYALRCLNDPAEAARHFRMTASLATSPANRSRAEYWLGRASDAAGQPQDAAEHYRAAGRFPTTFYGQLALVNLGNPRLPISPPPSIDGTTEQRFLARELVQAAARLASIGRREEAEVIYRHLSQTLADPAEIVLLAATVAAEGNYPLALQVGKVANARQGGLEAVAFPIAALPSLERSDVELPAVYAVARQESAFAVGALSPVGARGLLQLMPATAKEVAGRLGLTYSVDRLGTDAAYNATLGAAFLGSLVARFNGSYAMSFAAYNAGEGRVQGWAKTYGDPRDPHIDGVDWIERIPFDETRNYVERTLENLQVYRARLGSPDIRLAEDLTGGPGDRLDPLIVVGIPKQAVEDSRKTPELRRLPAKRSHVTSSKSSCGRKAPPRINPSHPAGRHCAA